MFDGKTVVLLLMIMSQNCEEVFTPIEYKILNEI